MHYKPNKLGPGVLRDTGQVLPYRDPQAVERIVGKVRKAVQIGTGFFEWPIWKAYPTWNQFNEQLAQERADAEKEGRDPHPSAAPPPRPTRGDDNPEYGPRLTHTPHRGLKARPFKY